MSQVCKFTSIAVVLGILGCGSSEGSSPGLQGLGGSDGASGGNASTTGGSAATEASTGGSGVAVGGAATSTGGSNATGGNSQVVAATGGQATGGNATGGSTADGVGGNATGGKTNATGGQTSATGGKSSATGGTAAAGASAGGGASLKKFVGNITSSNGRTDSGTLKYKDYWNQVTPQNEGKWGSVSNAKGQYNWSSLDTLYNYTKTNNVIFKQHVFVWGSQQPTYSITETDVKDWMTQFCKRYPDVAIIDVVNEPPPHTTPSYASAIGGGTNGDWAWITNSFKWAREACPNAVLVFNDYNNLEWDTDNKHFIDIVNTIKKNGAPLDAIGCQAHDLDHTNSSGAFDVDVAGVTKRLNALIAAHPNIYITELDLSTKDDAAQLKLYKDYFPLFWNSENVKGITIWGWVVGQTWSMAPDSGLITSSGTKRPAFTWLLQQIGR